jgi:hypothetical protein
MDTVMRGVLEGGFSAMLLWVLKVNLPDRKFYEPAGGEPLHEKPIEIGSQAFFEVAYGWKDLLPFLLSKE